MEVRADVPAPQVGADQCAGDSGADAGARIERLVLRGTLNVARYGGRTPAESNGEPFEPRRSAERQAGRSGTYTGSWWPVVGRPPRIAVRARGRPESHPHAR